MDPANSTAKVPPPFPVVEFRHRSGATDTSKQVHWTRFCGYPGRRRHGGYFIGPLRTSARRFKSVIKRIRYPPSKEIGWDLYVVCSHEESIITQFSGNLRYQKHHHLDRVRHHFCMDLRRFVRLPFEQRYLLFIDDVISLEQSPTIRSVTSEFSRNKM